MRPRVTDGRPLAETDTPTSQPVVVVNRTFARQYLDANPVGSPLPVSLAGRSDWTVAGVVDDMRQGGNTISAPAPFGGLGDPPEPEIYLSYRQHNSSVQEIVFVVRSTRELAFLTPALREILRSEDASLLPDSIMTLEDRVMSSIARPRTYAVLLGGFALFALVIAGAGLFGALSYATAQRTREIGLRMALGARRQEIVDLVIRQATATLGVGLTIGLATAFLLAQSLSTLLYGVTPRDLISFLAAPLILAIVGLTACAGPAMRAARVDPAVALR